MPSPYSAHRLPRCPAWLPGALLLLGLVLAPVAWAAAESLHCAVCGKAITGQYLKANGKAYCSQACLDKTLPHCAVCSKLLNGPYLTANGKAYCSKECLNTTAPKCEICGVAVVDGGSIKGHFFCKQHLAAPRCTICLLPTDEHATKLPDGRLLCPACQATAITTTAAAEALYVKAQQDVRLVTGLEQAAPPLHLVWADELAKLMPASIKIEDHMTERGLYVRNELTMTQKTGDWGDIVDTKTTRTINLLLGQSPAQFRISAAHELTHDLTAEQFHAFTDAPTWVQEGICQFVAAQVARQLGANDVLKAIADSPDSVYGPGYRYFVKLAGTHGWPAIQQWMATADVKKLPAKCPEK